MCTTGTYASSEAREPLLVSTRGAVAATASAGLAPAGSVAAILLATGVSPWTIVAIAIGGAVVGGLAVFYSHRFWGSLVLRQLEQIDRRFGAIATEAAIANGELYHLRAEVAAMRRALDVPPPSTQPPPEPTRTERP
jgi:hypothetical protein